MKELCVIGWPVSHSKSPLLHNTMLSELGLAGEYRYGLQPLRPEELPGFLEEVRRGRYVGFNATMPFKELLVPYMDVLDPLAERLGAVNTVCLREGKLHGFNTDCPGFVRALRGAGCEPEGKRVLLLGAGGAAAAVAVGLEEAGAHVTVANRTAEKAKRVAALCGGEAAAWTADSLCAAASQADVLVNATSLGMEGQGQFESLGFLDALPAGALVSDLIYHPERTALLERAEALGHPVMNGLPLLIHQAVLALERLVERTVPVEEVLPPLHRALEVKKPDQKRQEEST